MPPALHLVTKPGGRRAAQTPLTIAGIVMDDCEIIKRMRTHARRAIR
jgi:hypothetical protein